MIKVLPVAGLLLCTLGAYAQSTDTAVVAPSGSSEMPSVANTMAIHKLKNKDQILPRKFIDLNYRSGWLSQDIQMIDLSKSYTNSLGTSRYVNPKYNGLKSYGGDVQIGYFFGKNRRIGLGIGAMYMQHTGTLTLSEFKADYQRTDAQDRIFRQIVSSNGAIKEDIKITNINIPLLLKFKYHFPKSNFGITADVGGLAGVYNQTKYNVSGTMNYEAVYRLSQDKQSVVSGFDGGDIPDPSQSLVLTQAQFKNTNPEGDAAQYFDKLRSQNNGFNVGLNKSALPNESNGTKSYTQISLGFMAQLGISYALSYNVALNLSGYYAYQSYQNTNNNNYLISENVMQDGASYYGDYKGMTGGIERSTYTHYGISAGIRIFFGEKSDIDGDGLIDIKDHCMYVYGSAQKNGCPDRDGDGVVDDDDACPDEFGSEYTNGCPDRDGDGFADKVDECPDEPGEYKGCTAEFISSKRKPETNLVDQTGAIMAPHVVLETDIVNYEYNKTAVPDSSLPILENTVKILQKNPKVVIHISGYTDDIGSYTSNIILSYERAKNIKAFMLKNGIPENRVILSAYGMEHPVSENNSDSNRAKNRRIEFKLLLPID